MMPSQRLGHLRALDAEAIHIHLQGTEIVAPYRAAPRPVVELHGTLICIDDERLLPHLTPAQRAGIRTRWVRFAPSAAIR